MIYIQTDGRTWATSHGHARYAPLGYDIVCASISALWQTLIASLEHYSECFVENDDIRVLRIQHRDKVSDTLFKSFTLGCQMIEQVYPNNIHIEIERTE